MRARPLIIIALALAASLLLGAKKAPEQNVFCETSMDGLRLKLKMPVRNKPGQPIVVLVGLDNETDEEVSMIDSTPLVRLSVQDTEGRTSRSQRRAGRNWGTQVASTEYFPREPTC